MTKTSQAELIFQFKSPEFNGVGYSSHVQTIENTSSVRRKAIEDARLQAAKDAATAANNTNLVKFLNNFESRVYAQLSTQLINNLFGENPQNSGTLMLEGNKIQYFNVSSKYLNDLRTGFDNYKTLSGFEGLLLMDLPTQTAQYFTDFDDMLGLIKNDAVYLYAPESEMMPKVTLSGGGGKVSSGMSDSGEAEIEPEPKATKNLSKAAEKIASGHVDREKPTDGAGVGRAKRK